MPLTTKITFTIELPAGLPAAPLILERTRRAPRPTWPLVLVLSSWSGAFQKQRESMPLYIQAAKQAGQWSISSPLCLVHNYR